MIPGISIIVFLKCRDLGIGEASARFCLGDLLYLGPGAPGATEGLAVWAETPQDLPGSRTNEAALL